jgi:hypothetical protein
MFQKWGFSGLQPLFSPAKMALLEMLRSLNSSTLLALAIVRILLRRAISSLKMAF